MLKFYKLCFTAGLILFLGGCLTAPPHSMSVSDFQKYRIVDVKVEGAEIIRSWPVQEETYVKLNPVDADTLTRIQTEPAYKFPALRAHIERALNERLKLEFASQVYPLFSGTRPVKAIVRLRNFDVPSAGRRVFVDNDAKIKADIELVDPSTGASVLNYEGPFRSRRLIGGLATPIALALDQSDTGYSMLTEYITTYRNWLLKN